jgi:hypothetical protein
MHLFEQLLGISPDGDNGLWEVLVFAALAILCHAAWRMRRKPAE